MTRKLSLTAALAVVALSVGAPAAFGKVHAAAEVYPAQAQQKSGVGTYRDASERPGAGVLRGETVYLDWFERAAKRAENQAGPSTYRDAFERGSVTVLGDGGIASTLAGYQDAFERAAAFERARSSAVVNYKDAFERAVPLQGSVPVSVTSGTDIEWPQVGVGLGIGLLLALGLGLIMRVVHIRRFAH